MRIAHVCRTGWPVVGGLERSVGGLARAQVARGHEVHVVTLVPGDALDAGVRYVRLERLGPRRWPFARGLVDAIGPTDVVHVHGLDGLLDTLLLSGVRPIGVSTHGGYFHTGRQRLVKELWLRTGTAWSFARADRVWFTSDADRARLAAAGRTGPLMPDGVDVARFAGVVRRPEPGRWLVPGRVDVHKGLDDLVRAAEGLPVRIEIAGREHAPGLVDRLRAEAAARRVDVVFLGELVGDALLDALGRVERAVFPSRYEGFGIAAVEAMAARVPVVLSDIPAFRAHAGVAPLCDFRAPDARRRLVAALAAPHDVDVAARHVATFDWEARAIAWDAAYGELA